MSASCARGALAFRHVILFLLAVQVAGARVLTGALTPTPVPTPDTAKIAPWLAVFEQSYGREGLYVVEISPGDDAAGSRLNLQSLTAAAERFQHEHPGEAVSLKALKDAGMMPALDKHPDEETYRWDDEHGLFRSSLGGSHDAAAGALFLLRGNDIIRRRILRPDGFTRQRWRKIYTDPEAPPFLKHEIELREFLLEHFFFEKARQAEAIQKQLERLEEVLKIYAAADGKQVGDPVNWGDLEAGRYDEFIPEFPKGTEVKLDKIGEAPVAHFEGMEITSDPASVGKIRYDHAKPVWEKYSDYPPALALRARFEEPGTAIPLLTRAISQWPDVPGLRVERMTHLARIGRIGSWSEDLDYIFRYFPAAPLLIEIQQLAETEAFTKDTNAEADFAVMLADIRPDLLTHQLYALRALTEHDRLKDAQLIYDRLTYANPAWRLLLNPPSEKKDTEAGKDGRAADVK